MENSKRDSSSILYKIFTRIAILFTSFILIYMIVFIFKKGIPYLSFDIFSPNYTSENQSMFPAIITSLMTVALSLLIAGPIGIGTGIYLSEYQKPGSKFVKVIRIVTETLAAIPSIIYGLFGFLFFNITLGVGYSLISGVLTVSIMILPLIVRATEESLNAVEMEYRLGSYALGAGTLRTIFRVVLPISMPGILSGIILAIGRVIGETAALLYTLGTSTNIPTKLTDSGITLALHMYKLSGEGRYTGQAYATGVVLIFLILILNYLSSALANKIGDKHEK